MKKRILNRYFSVLAFFARKYLKKHKPYIIGINWSVGKTSCRMIIYQTLCKFVDGKKIYTSSKNFNGELWLSLSIFGIEQWSPNIFTFIFTLIRVIRKTFFGKHWYDIILLEYGIDRPKEMEFLLHIAKPHIGVFTAIDSVHSEQFWHIAAIAEEEVKMVKNTLDVVFLNEQDPYAMQLIKEKHIKVDTLVYQTQGHKSNAAVSFDNERFVSPGDGKIQVHIDLNIRWKMIPIETNLLWKANYWYIGVALAITDIVLHTMKKTPVTDNFEKLFLEYKLQPWRFSIFKGINNSILVDSTYNASPLSVKKIIETVYTMRRELFPERKIWVLMWDMRELGDATVAEHRKIAPYIQAVAENVFLVGKETKEHVADELKKIGYPSENIYTFTTAKAAAKYIKELLYKVEDEIIIIGKWSQNTIFLEEAIKDLLEDKNDAQNLTRQWSWWLHKKRKFFLENA